MQKFMDVLRFSFILPKLPGHRHGIAHGANVVHGLETAVDRNRTRHFSFIKHRDVKRHQRCWLGAWSKAKKKKLCYSIDASLATREHCILVVSGRPGPCIIRPESMRNCLWWKKSCKSQWVVSLSRCLQDFFHRQYFWHNELSSTPQSRNNSS